MTAAELLEIVECRPENLLLADQGDLIAFVRDDFNEVGLRRHILAELIVRWCRSGDAGLEQELPALLGETGWRSFSDWYTVQSVWMRTLPDRPDCWSDPTWLPGLTAVLRSRLTELFSVDGFIPVCRGPAACFIPFKLEKDLKGACWRDGTPVRSPDGGMPWGESVARALKGSTYTGIRLFVSDGPEFGPGLAGDSLMLPVRLAAWRREGQEFPQYDVLSVLATGALADDFRLVDVDVSAKVAAFRGGFRHGSVLFGPDVPGEIPRDERCYFPIDRGATADQIREKLKDALEAKGLARITRDYAKKRLLRMTARVDHENHSRWAEVASQLASLRTGMNARRDFDEWLEYMSLLATAYCHAGQTNESCVVVEEARAAARQRGRVAKALRLQLTAAVNAQDMGEMDEFDALIEGLGAELARFEGPEKLDLQMRYHGTRGQALAWGVVFGRANCSVDEAVGEVAKAVENAYALAETADDPHREEAEANIAQDLNYAHMLQALFAPGSPEESRAYQEAVSQQENLNDESTRRNNRHFLMRQRSQALFNAWCCSGTLPQDRDMRENRLPFCDAASWLVMANRRHLGALAAARGEAEEARLCFEEGARALELADCQAPVFAAIRLAFLAQAVVSLRAVELSAKSESYQTALEEVFGAFCETALFKNIRAERWMKAVRDGADPRRLPHFYY